MPLVRAHFNRHFRKHRVRPRDLKAIYPSGRILAFALSRVRPLKKPIKCQHPGCNGPDRCLIKRSRRYCFFVPRKRGDSDRVKSTTSSPVTVLMSWCRLDTLTPVIS